MAVLPDADRRGVWADFMQNLSRESQSIAITKADLRAAVNALDDFLNTNATAINSAIPQPARGSLTVAQKALLLMYVVARRYLTGA